MAPGVAAPAGVDEAAVVQADQPFHLRFETGVGHDPETRRYGLQVRRNAGEWQPVPTEDFPYPEKVLDVSADALMMAFGSWIDAAGSSPGTVQAASGGGVEVQAGREPFYATVRPPIHWEPVEFALSLRLPDRPDARFGVQFMEFEHGGTAWISLARSGAVELWVEHRMQARRLAQGSANLAPGRWLELTISAGDEVLTVEVGDVEVIETVLDPELQGLRRLGFRLPANHTVQLRALTIEGEPASPPVSIVPSASLPPAGHGEWVFPLVIRRFSDHAVLMEEGDHFEFRLAHADGRAVASGTTIAVTLEVPDGHLGGTFAETPMRIGPWQGADGVLYTLMEPSETWNRMMMVRSQDGGRTWREVDGDHRPATGDLEGLGSRFVNGKIHVLHQVSERVLYHVFQTGDPGERDAGWVVRDEFVAAPPEPPTQVADVAVRSDGSVVAFYGAGEGLEYRVRSPAGYWGDARRIGDSGDHPDDLVLSGISVVPGQADVVHLAYTVSDGSAWYRRLADDLSLSEPVRFATGLGTGDEDVGAVAPLVHHPDPDRVTVTYRADDGLLYARSVNASGDWTEAERVSARTVAQSPVDSDQVVADAVLYGEELHVLFVEAETGHLFHAARRDGAWLEAGPVVADATVQWVRGQVVTRPDGSRAYGFIYDAGSNGGSGMNRYGEIPLP
ncbi:MAG: sialidase family protein [Xanthomonadales bacterium]|nr:sialidase family protein [Xanthomonadales bacterium]